MAVYGSYYAFVVSLLTEMPSFCSQNDMTCCDGAVLAGQRSTVDIWWRSGTGKLQFILDNC